VGPEVEALDGVDLAVDVFALERLAQSEVDAQLLRDVELVKVARVAGSAAPTAEC